MDGGLRWSPLTPGGDWSSNLSRNLSKESLEWVRDYEREEIRMGLTVSDSGGGSFQDAPPGTHVARAVKIIDLGTQKSEWQGEEKIKHQLLMVWELPNEELEVDGLKKPFTISKFYNASSPREGHSQA